MGKRQAVEISSGLDASELAMTGAKNQPKTYSKREANEHETVQVKPRPCQNLRKPDAWLQRVSTATMSRGKVQSNYTQQALPRFVSIPQLELKTFALHLGDMSPSISERTVVCKPQLGPEVSRPSPGLSASDICIGTYRSLQVLGTGAWTSAEATGVPTLPKSPEPASDLDGSWVLACMSYEQIYSISHSNMTICSSFGHVEHTQPNDNDFGSIRVPSSLSIDGVTLFPHPMSSLSLSDSSNKTSFLVSLPMCYCGQCPFHLLL